jgi:hypothetical protein
MSTATFPAPDPSTIAAGEKPVAWSIVWRGLKFDESQLTGQHLSVLSLISGTDDFTTLDVDPRHGHQRLMMMIAACVVVAAANSVGDEFKTDDVAALVAEAVEEVASAPAEEILGALHFG